MNTPKVGVGVIILRNSKVLLGKRKGSHGSSSWCMPGGHLELNESWEECARREVKEETGMEVISSSFVTATNDIFEKEQKHYITIFMLATAEGEPELVEPEKCDGWQWFSWDDLPQPLFLPIENLLKQGYRP